MSEKDYSDIGEPWKTRSPSLVRLPERRLANFFFL